MFVFLYAGGGSHVTETDFRFDDFEKRYVFYLILFS